VANGEWKVEGWPPLETANLTTWRLCTPGLRTDRMIGHRSALEVQKRNDLNSHKDVTKGEGLLSVAPSDSDEMWRNWVSRQVELLHSPETYPHRSSSESPSIRVTRQYADTPFPSFR